MNWISVAAIDRVPPWNVLAFMRLCWTCRVAQVGELLPLVPSIERVVFLCGAAAKPATRDPALAFDEWLDGTDDGARWDGFDEREACGLCYTSVTTAIPRAC